MIYKGILKERESWVNIAVLIAACFMIFLSVSSGKYTYAVLSLVVVLAVFFKKEHIISKEGVIIRYNLFGWSHENGWAWAEITALKTDYKKAAPNVLLHIGKDVTIRDFVMKKSDIPKILRLAKEMNPDIYIGDLSEAAREKQEEEALHQMEIERARQAEKKRKK